RGNGQDAALSEQSTPHAVAAERDAPEMAAVDVWHAVVAREPLVQERVIGGQQLERAAILPHDALEKQLRLALKRSAQRVIEIGKARRHRSGARQVAQVQPLSGEVVHE